MSDELPEPPRLSKGLEISEGSGRSGGPGRKDPPGPSPAPARAGLRASDADRDRVAELLREAVAEGRLDMEEFGTRLDAAYRARTYGELEPLTRDLPAAFSAPSAGTRPAVGDDWSWRVGRQPTSRGAFALFGGFGRSGRWVAPKLFTAFAMWGGGEIDLREADFEGRETVICCFTIWGGIAVIVPPELNVRVTGTGIMGGFGGDRVQEGEPDAPQVTVTGFALMGGVGVKRKLRKAEKRRLKELERELRERDRERERDRDPERREGQGAGGR